jgi:hypothetical protein
MAPDVDLPTPPDLTNRGIPDELDADEGVVGERDLHRAELERVLDEGAWREGFEEWAEYTDLSETDVQQAEAVGLFRALDLFWDPDAERLRYQVPEVPGDWDDRVGGEGSPASTVQQELDELGRTVAETIATDYVDWGAAEPADLVWSVQTFGQVPTRERE